jgi:HK97 family phage major capsid protein
MSDLIQQYIQKAAVATTTGGQLTPQQLRRFLTTVRSESELLSRVTIQPMSANTFYLDIISIAGRQMRAAVEGTDPGFTANVTIPRRSLVTKEVILPYDVTYTFLEENIAGGGVEAALNAYFATAFAKDLQDSAINGDEDSGDAFLNINDGWIDIADADGSTNKYTNASSDWKDTILPAMWSLLPPKYRSEPGLVYLMSFNDYDAYWNQLGNRATIGGDKYLEQFRDALPYHGRPVIPVSSWPDNRPMLTTFSNLAIGIGRNITREAMRQPRPRKIEYTLTAKLDFNYAISEMVVIGNVA